MTKQEPPIRKVVIVGGAGLIGTCLRKALTEAGSRVTLVSRNPGREPLKGVQTIGWETAGLVESIRGSDAVVNLAGESLGGKRWNPEVKERLRKSRIATTGQVVEAIRSAGMGTRLINASAVGYYGDGEAEMDESSPVGTGFLAELCRDWEAEAMKANAFGSRVAIARIGVVFSPDGGALVEMVKPFRFGFGGPIASGRQWLSWIHSVDVANALVHLCRQDGPIGPVNLTSPHAIRNADLAKEIGTHLHRPAFIRAPAFALRMALGEFAEALIGGQNVVPKVLLQTGFEWRFPTIQVALRDAIR